MLLLQSCDPWHFSSHLVSVCELCAARSSATNFLYTTFGSDFGEFPGLWSSIAFRHVPIPWKGSFNNTSNCNLVSTEPRGLLLLFCFQTLALSLVRVPFLFFSFTPSVMSRRNYPVSSPLFYAVAIGFPPPISFGKLTRPTS